MNHPSPEFDDAVAAAFHGTADAAQLEAVARLVAADAAALDHYIRLADLHAALLASPERGLAAATLDSFEPATSAAAVIIDPIAADRGRHADRPGALGWAIASGVVAMIGLIAVLATGASRDPRPAAVVARLGEFSAVEWVRSDADAQPGDPVRAGDRIELAAGSLKIDFASGASVRLTAPAIFEAESALAATLTMGRASVTAATPESKGFTIHTRTGRIVDLGTEFTAEALPDGRCRVGVTSGEVRFHLANSDVSHLLRAGGMMDVEPGRRQVVTRIERGDESAAFVFPSIEPPSADDLADASRGRARIYCVRGMLYENPAKHLASAAPEILLDGKAQSGPDSPAESLYFAAGEEGGLVLDLGAKVAVTKVNLYSWHRCLDPGFPAALREAHRERAAQHYAIYGHAGDSADGTDLVAAAGQAGTGWTLIAKVNSDQHFGLAGNQRPAQQASSVTSAREPLGRFRYLMFVIEPISGIDHDGELRDFGTFCGEIDVYGE